MENHNFNKNVEKFIKWVRICIITTMIIALFGIGALTMTLLKELTDLEVKAPYLYSKIFAWIALFVLLVLVIFEIFCYVKARKYKKWAEKSENEEADE